LATGHQTFLEWTGIAACYKEYAADYKFKEWIYGTELKRKPKGNRKNLKPESSSKSKSKPSSPKWECNACFHNRRNQGCYRDLDVFPITHTCGTVKTGINTAAPGLLLPSLPRRCTS
jgi:hypothetical protein